MSEHYKSLGKDLLGCIGDARMDFRVFNALKYVWRLGLKDSVESDAAKADDYLNRAGQAITSVGWLGRNHEMDILEAWEKVRDTPIGEHKYYIIRMILEGRFELARDALAFLKHEMTDGLPPYVIGVVAMDDHYVIGRAMLGEDGEVISSDQPPELVDRFDRLLFHQVIGDFPLIAGRRTRELLPKRLQDRVIPTRQSPVYIENPQKIYMAIGGAETLHAQMEAGEISAILVHHMPDRVPREHPSGAPSKLVTLRLDWPGVMHHLRLFDRELNLSISVAPDLPIQRAPTRGSAYLVKRRLGLLE